MDITPSFTLDQQPLPDGLLLTVKGDIDFGSSPDLRSALLSALQSKPARLVIDLSEVTYMDSSGIATFIEALQLQRKSGRKLILSALQPKVVSIFEIAKLDTLFTIALDNDAAKNA